MTVTPATYANLFNIHVMGTPEDIVKITFAERENGQDVAHIAVAMSRSNAVQLAKALTNLLNATDGSLRADLADNVATLHRSET